MSARPLTHDAPIPDYLTELSPAQNERLRVDMTEYRRRMHWTKARMAAELKMQASSLSRFINRHGGIARENAERYAKLRGKKLESLMGPPEPQPGEELHGITMATMAGPIVDERRMLPPGPITINDKPDGGAVAERMMSVSFVMNLKRMPGLEDWLIANPTVHLPISRLAQAMEAFLLLGGNERGDGSLLWWSQFLQPYVSGHEPRTVSGSQRKYAPGE